MVAGRTLVVLAVVTLAAAKLTDHWSVINEKCGAVHCPGETATILDYNETSQECVCREHPCHNHKGFKWVCDDPKYPFLAFSYNQEAQLECVCKEHPCAESKCESDVHEIRWDHNGVCYCGSKTGES
eukprot:Hpha_TRINITY_DN30737_c0_g1::TRINITY_DN30737_c0_g1_i1::g.28369::m.28369